MHAELAVKVTPRASRNRLELQPDGSLRAWVAAAPVGGQANDALCELVAQALRLATGRVSVIRGHASRDKRLRVEGLDPAACAERLAARPQ